MEKLVQFRDRQELQSADLSNIGQFARSALDHVVFDAVEYGKAYSGMTTEKTGATEITVGVGRLYSLGAIYGHDTATTIDLFNKLPQVTRKRVAVVAWGQGVDSDVQPRDFLIDAQTGETQPENVAMQTARVATISIVDGIEAPDPSYPATSADVTVVAYILLDRSGVLSVEQWTTNGLANIRRTDNRAAALELWKSEVGAQVDSLRTDLANLASATVSRFNQVNDALSAIARQLEELRNQTNRPASFLQFTTNHFLDLEDVDTARGGFDAIVSEGIRLPYAASDVGQLALLNPQDVNAHLAGNLLLPVYSHNKRIVSGAADAELRMAVYAYQTLQITQKTVARSRIRYGAAFVVCSNSAFWQTGNYDAAKQIFTRNGETYVVEAMSYDAHGWIRLAKFWYDYWTEPYTDVQTIQHSVSGQTIAQTFLNSQDGWLSQVGFYLSRVAASGDVWVVITETTNGSPDMSKAIGYTQVNVGSLKVGENKVVITPTFLKAGKRYAAVFISGGDHYIYTTMTGNANLQGTLFTATDNAYFLGVMEKDLCVDLYFAKWSQTRYALDCDPFILAGGVHDIDVLQNAIRPAATELHYEVQINGIWKPLDGAGAVNLSVLPPLLPLRIVFIGTTDLMPACGINESSQVILSRPKTAAVCFSKGRALGSGSTAVKLQFKLENFNSGQHTFAAKLHCGATYETLETADVVSDFTLPDGAIIRTVTFNITSATKYYIETNLGVSSIDNVFHVAEMVEYAQA